MMIYCLNNKNDYNEREREREKYSMRYFDSLNQRSKIFNPKRRGAISAMEMSIDTVEYRSL
jgi:hypothetical protein